MKYWILILASFCSSTLMAQQNSSGTKGATPLNDEQLFLSPKNTYAVVVGISDYQDKDIPDLRFADKDAEEFANFLRSPAGGSLDADHLKVLTNTQATAGRIAEALDALIEKVKKDDQVIIYFSGHGDVERKTVSQPGFLLAWDAPSRVYMGGGTYSLAFLQEVVTTLSTQNLAKVVVITDACHAGKLSGNQIGGSQLTAASLAKQYANEVKILSCQPNEFSLEGPQWGGGRGVFSYHLIDGLFGLADRNNDGQITLGEIDRYLEDHVTAEAAPQSQVPILLGNKTEKLATVNANILADLKKNKTVNMAVFAASESRGFEEEILVKLDTSIREIYKAFKLAVQEKRFLLPAENCADNYYKQLEKIQTLNPLQGIMKRNFAAALQDDAQQVLNTMLKSSLTSEILSSANVTEIYKDYPTYLGLAAQLLGKDHYMYPILQARKHYFTGYIQSTAREAKSQYFQALKWQTDMPQVYVDLINTYFINNIDSAEYFARKAMDMAPFWIKPYTELSLFYSDNGLKEKAGEVLDRALEVDSVSIMVWYAKAWLYAKNRNYTQAEYWYNKVIAAAREDICFPCAYNNLGSVYRYTRRYNEAEEQYKKAIQLDSTFTNAYYNLACLQSQQNRTEAAFGYLEKALKYGYNNYDWMQQDSTLAPLREQKDRWEALMRIAIVPDTTDAKAWNNLGLLYIRTHNYATAEAATRKAIALDATSAPFRSNLGFVYLNLGRYSEAEVALKKAIALDSTYANPHKHMGMVCFKTNSPEEAQQNFLKAIALNPNYTGAILGMAYTLQAAGKTAEAIGYVEQPISKGITFEQLENDEDLAPLRATPDWNALMKKHFPDQFKE